MPWLKVHGLSGVVDERETSRTATTELGPETEDDDLLLVSLVHGGELLGELLAGDVGPGWVDNVDDALPSLKEAVRDELASSEGDWCGSVLCGAKRGS